LLPHKHTMSSLQRLSADNIY